MYATESKPQFVKGKCKKVVKTIIFHYSHFVVNDIVRSGTECFNILEWETNHWQNPFVLVVIN